MGPHFDALRLGIQRRLRCLDAERDDLVELDRLHAQLDPAGGDAPDVEQVVHQPAQVGHLALDHGQAPVCQHRILRRQPHRRERAVHRRQRIAQFMRKGGQELIHALAGAFQLFAAAALAHVPRHLGKAAQRA
ncbi:hypothetical protein D3C72_1333140 [compost metagenome]